MEKSVQTIEEKLDAVSTVVTSLSARSDILTGMVVDLSQSVDALFDAVDKRFDAVDKRFEQLEKKIEYKIDDLAAMTARQFFAIDKRFDNIEKELATTVSIEYVDARFIKTEELIENLAVVTKSGFERLEHRFALKEEVHRLSRRVVTLEEKVG